MAKRRGLFLIFLSLMMAVGAAWVANSWVKTQMISKANAEPNKQFVVAADDFLFHRLYNGIIDEFCGEQIRNNTSMK